MMTAVARAATMRPLLRALPSLTAILLANSSPLDGPPASPDGRLDWPGPASQSFRPRRGRPDRPRPSTSVRASPAERAPAPRAPAGGRRPPPVRAAACPPPAPPAPPPPAAAGGAGGWVAPPFFFGEIRPDMALHRGLGHTNRPRD